jgi:hypothetical protein
MDREMSPEEIEIAIAQLDVTLGQGGEEGSKRSIEF